MANIVLSDGKNVEISNVRFNKEQKINVTKTYVTTVKKAVTRVSEDFYKIEDKHVDMADEVQDLLTESPVEMAMPELNLEEPAHEEKPLEVVENTESTENEMPMADEVQVIPPVEEAKPVLETVQEEVVPSVAPVNPQPEPEPVKAPEVLPIEEIKNEEPMETPAAPSMEQSEPEAPHVNPQPVESTPISEVSVSVNEEVATSEPKLFFDASNESNLNKALGEVSEEKVVTAPQEGVESLREFGEEQIIEDSIQEDAKKLTRSKGFANNKFFMVIAIAFFVAACVFLGYEAFQYFQLQG